MSEQEFSEQRATAFDRLGLKVSLLISEDQIRDAFRKSAAIAHPDSGGDEKEFSQLQLAQQTLLNPSSRLKEWLFAKGEKAESRGQIDDQLMDLFQKVAEYGSGTEQIIKERERAQSALAKAMVEVKLIAQREKVEALIDEVEQKISEREGLFAKIESGDLAADKPLRDLIFLEKWKATLRAFYGKLL